MGRVYSWWVISGTALVGMSLPQPLSMIASILAGRSGFGPADFWAALSNVAMPGLGGTLIGWLALNKIRESGGRERGLPLALFATLTWPLILLGALAVGLPMLLVTRGEPTLENMFGRFLVLLLPAGVIGFGFWLVQVMKRWANQKPAPHERGILKWSFIAVVILLMAAVMNFSPSRPTPALAEAGPDVTTHDTNRWVMLTFTAVELREVAGGRWLAMDYLDQVNGGCEKSFPWESSISDFKATIRTSEFFKDMKASPPMRHQRIEYRIPDSLPRESFKALHAAVEKQWKFQSILLKPGEQKMLFEIFATDNTSLKAWVKAGLPTISPATTPNASLLGASAELWAPELVPGEKPNVSEILQEAKRLTDAGRYEEALQRHIWYHNHALEIQPSQVGVRLSFALMYWGELAQRYPKAKEALNEILDRGTQAFANGEGRFALFMEVNAINRQLGRQKETLSLFESIQAQDPRLARQCYGVVEDLLVEKGDYGLCESFIPDFQKRFETIRAGWQRPLSDRNPEANRASLREHAQRTFIKDTRKLVEILVGVSRNTEAEAIRDQAVALLDVPELRSAMTDAEQKVASHSVAPGKP